MRTTVELNDAKGPRMTRKKWSDNSAPVPPTPGVPTTSMTDPIAASLQQLFAPIAAEPIPDEFMALLDRIDAASRAGEAATRSEAGGPGVGR